MAFFFSLNELALQLDAVTDPVLSQDGRRQLISLIDLTSLNENDSPESIAALCHKAESSYGPVAALCVYPRFVKQVAVFLKGSPIRTATVANFPHGTSPLSAVLKEIETSLREGAQEVDVVFPYAAYLQGERAAAVSLVNQCKQLCGEAHLKVILETAVLGKPELIAEVTAEVLQAGADFVKTSTGKLPQGATLAAAAAILLTIKELSPKIQRPLGFKAAGGLRDPQQALQYLLLAKHILGPSWPTPHSFRLGASQLLDKLAAATPN